MKYVLYNMFKLNEERKKIFFFSSSSLFISLPLVFLLFSSDTDTGADTVVVNKWMSFIKSGKVSIDSGSTILSRDWFWFWLRENP